MIIYEDSDWLAVNKPTGLATHGGREGDTAMQEWLDLHWNRKTFVCSRLDKGTSGVLLFAKTAAASGRAQKIHETEHSIKEYIFLSHKNSLETQWTIRTPLDGAPAQTEFHRIGPKFRHRAVIRRGRTHQIRRHAQEAGIPILGDDEYGGQPAPRIFLHCLKVSWPEIPAALEAPLPESFERADRQDLFACFDRRLDYLPTITNAFRAVHFGEIPGFDGAIDVLGNTARVKGTTPFIEDVMRRYGLNGWTAIDRPGLEIIEHGLRYGSGLRLEHRDLRRWIFKWAKGKKVANLADPSCSAAAAAGEAEVVFTVGATQRGTADFAKNGLDRTRRGKFVEANAGDWLGSPKRRESLDLIVCRGNLARPARAALSPGGVAVLTAKTDRDIKKVFERVNCQTPPFDFPGPSSEKIFFCSRPGKVAPLADL